MALLKDLKKLKRIEEFNKFKEGKPLVAGTLNANFEAILLQNENFTDSLNEILAVLNSLKSKYAQVNATSSGEFDISSNRPAFEIVEIQRTIQSSSARQYLTAAIDLQGAANSPTSDELLIKIDVPGDFAGDVFEEDTSIISSFNSFEYNFDMYYTFSTDDTKQTYKIFAVLKTEIESGIVNINLPSVDLYLEATSDATGIELISPGFESTSTLAPWNLIDWELESLTDINAANKISKSGIPFAEFAEFLEDFIEDFGNIQDSVETLNTLIGQEPSDDDPSFMETHIYGQTPGAGDVLEYDTLINSELKALGFADLDNDTTFTEYNVPGGTDPITMIDGKAVIEGLDYRINTLENAGYTFGNGETMLEQFEAVNSSKDIIYGMDLAGYLATPELSVFPETPTGEIISALAEITKFADDSIKEDLTILESEIDQNRADINELKLADEEGTLFADRVKVEEVEWRAKANQTQVDNQTKAIQDLFDLNTASANYELNTTALTSGAVSATWTQINWNTENINTYPNITLNNSVFTATETITRLEIRITGQADSTGKSKPIILRMMKDGVQLGEVFSQSTDGTGYIKFERDFYDFAPGAYTFEIQTEAGGGTITFTSAAIRFQTIGISGGATLSPIFADGVNVGNVNWGDKADKDFVGTSTFSTVARTISNKDETVVYKEKVVNQAGTERHTFGLDNGTVNKEIYGIDGNTGNMWVGSDIDFNGTGLLSEILGSKADTTYVDGQLLGKSDVAYVDGQLLGKVDKVSTGTTTDGATYTSTVDSAVIAANNYAGSSFVRLENSAGFGFSVDTVLEDDGGGARLTYLPDTGTEIEILNDMSIPHKKYVDDNFVSSKGVLDEFVKFDYQSDRFPGMGLWADDGTGSIKVKNGIRAAGGSDAEDIVVIRNFVDEGKVASVNDITRKLNPLLEENKSLKNRIELLEAKIEQLLK